MVIGSPGSGKSTFSIKLAELTDIPLIHLDKEFWNNGATMDLRLEKADTVICFKLSRTSCLWGYFKRVITNLGKIRPDMAEGCPEKLDFEFMKYIWDFPKTLGQGNVDRLEKCRDKQIIVFKNRREENKYISELSNVRITEI